MHLLWETVFTILISSLIHCTVSQQPLEENEDKNVGLSMIQSINLNKHNIETPNAIENESCICIEKSDENAKTVSQILNPEAKPMKRLVIYLYETEGDDKKNVMFIPNINKQKHFPDLYKEYGDIIFDIHSKTMDMLVENNPNSITQTEFSVRPQHVAKETVENDTLSERFIEWFKKTFKVNNETEEDKGNEGDIDNSDNESTESPDEIVPAENKKDERLETTTIWNDIFDGNDKNEFNKVEENENNQNKPSDNTSPAPDGTVQPENTNNIIPWVIQTFPNLNQTEIWQKITEIVGDNNHILQMIKLIVGNRPLTKDVIDDVISRLFRIFHNSPNQAGHDGHFNLESIIQNLRLLSQIINHVNKLQPALNNNTSDTENQNQDGVQEDNNFASFIEYLKRYILGLNNATIEQSNENNHETEEDNNSQEKHPENDNINNESSTETPHEPDTSINTLGPISDADRAVLKRVFEIFLTEHGVTPKGNGFYIDKYGNSLSIDNIGVRSITVADIIPLSQLLYSLETKSDVLNSQYLLVTIIDPPSILGLIKIPKRNALTHIHSLNNHQDTKISGKLDNNDFTQYSIDFQQAKASATNEGIINNAPETKLIPLYMNTDINKLNMYQGFNSYPFNKLVYKLNRSKGDPNKGLRYRAKEPNNYEIVSSDTNEANNGIEINESEPYETDNEQLTQEEEDMIFKIIGGHAATGSGTPINIKGRTGQMT